MDHNRRSFVYFYPNQIVTEYVSISMGFLFIYFLFIITLREHLILFILLNLDSKWIQEGEQQLLFNIRLISTSRQIRLIAYCHVE